MFPPMQLQLPFISKEAACGGGLKCLYLTGEGLKAAQNK